MLNRSPLFALLAIMLVCGIVASAVGQPGSSRSSAQGGRRPQGPPSRYRITLKFDDKSIPPGVKLTERNGQWWISNQSDTPVILNERFRNGELIQGTKVVSGKVYEFFRNGIPQEGKTHLKGWQPLEGTGATLLHLTREPSRMAGSREPGLKREIPPSEPFALTINYQEKPYDLQGTLQYHLNDEYDAYHQKQRDK